MHRQFQCPSCGAANEVTNPGILMRVCDYCKTAMYWDGESVLRTGRKSVDLPPSDRFRIGATGKIGSHSFRVVGRLSYSHDKGTWDEWFVEMQDGRIVWLTEDEEELFLETPMTMTSPVPSYEKLRPGMRISLGDKVGLVEELGRARCIGGEGQIPFAVAIGDTYPYADGSGEDGSFSFGLEYDAETGVATAFVGTIVPIGQAEVRPEEHAEPVTRAGRIIRCPSCGKPYEGPQVSTTRMVVCRSCGTGLELDEAQLKLVGKNKGKEPAFTFRVGTAIVLEKTRYEVMGRLLYMEKDEGGTYHSYEYVLYHPESGYAWLCEEDGHFTIKKVVHQAVSLPNEPTARMIIRVGPESFRFFERGTVTLRWVDGAIPWKAAVSEVTHYAHLIKPPEFMDKEVTGREAEFFRGHYLSREELLAALPEKMLLPVPRGVYSCQPYVAPDWIKGMTLIGSLFLLVNLVLVIYGLLADKTDRLLNQEFKAAQYTREQLTGPFNVSRDGAILRLDGSSPVDNSWIAFDFAVVNADDQVVSEFYGEVSFYHGRDSEGNWSEGSRSFSSHFKIDKAGTYRLLLRGQGGSGVQGPARNEPARIVVTSGHTISWYFAVPILLAGLVTLWQPLHRWRFEWKRWLPVTKEENDD